MTLTPDVPRHVGDRPQLLCDIQHGFVVRQPIQPWLLVSAGNGQVVQWSYLLDLWPCLHCSPRQRGIQKVRYHEKHNNFFAFIFAFKCAGTLPFSSLENKPLSDASFLKLLRSSQKSVVTDCESSPLQTSRLSSLSLKEEDVLKVLFDSVSFFS